MAFAVHSLFQHMSPCCCHNHHAAAASSPEEKTNGNKFKIYKKSTFPEQAFEAAVGNEEQFLKYLKMDQLDLLKYVF